MSCKRGMTLCIKPMFHKGEKPPSSTYLNKLFIKLLQLHVMYITPHLHAANNF